MKFLFFILAASISIAKAETKVIRIFTALCDNEHQGIVKVPAKIGNGDKPADNLYWGAMYGIKTWFSKSKSWEKISSQKVNAVVLERVVFKRKGEDVYLVADAFRGREMKKCLKAYFTSLTGKFEDSDSLKKLGLSLKNTKLSIFVGHNGLMDFEMPLIKGKGHLDAMSFCCKSRPFFNERIKAAGSNPFLLTNGFMAPEAYSISAAIDGWLLGNTPEGVARRAAAAYHKFQKCGHRGAYNLFKP